MQDNTRSTGRNLQARIDGRKDLTLSNQEIILQGNDSVLTSIPEIGYPYSVEFEIYADPKPNIDAVLFKGPHSVFTANWQNTGKFAFSRDGYEFIGWATSPSASKPQYSPKDTVSSTRDLTLYAVWEKSYLLSIKDIYSFPNDSRYSLSATKPQISNA